MTQSAAVVEPPIKKPSRLRRWSIRTLRIVVVTYILLALILFFAQTWLIFPGHVSQGKRWAAMGPVRNSEMVNLTTRDGDKIVALFGAALGPDGKPLPDASHRPTVLFFYGNASSLAFVLDQFRHLRESGANVLIPEFVGYGMSTGSPSETNFYETADAAYDYLLSRSDVDPHHIIAAGWSLGAAPAIDLAARKPVAGLITFCAFTRLSDMAREMFPIFPTSLLIRHHFDNVDKIATIDLPILLCHGRRDSIVPFRMADALAQAAKGKVIRGTYDSADHNNIFDVGGDALWSQVKSFLDARVVAAATQP